MISPMMCVGNYAYGLCCTLDLIPQSSHRVVKEKYKFIFLLLLPPHSRRSISKIKGRRFLLLLKHGADINARTKDGSTYCVRWH